MAVSLTMEWPDWCLRIRSTQRIALFERLCQVASRTKRLGLYRIADCRVNPQFFCFFSIPPGLLCLFGFEPQPNSHGHLLCHVVGCLSKQRIMVGQHLKEEASSIVVQEVKDTEASTVKARWPIEERAFFVHGRSSIYSISFRPLYSLS